MSFSTPFIIANPQAVIDSLVADFCRRGHRNDMVKIIVDFFRDRFNSSLIQHSIPCGLGSGGLVRIICMVQQNGLEPEYFYASHPKGLNTGYFRTLFEHEQETSETDTVCENSLVARKSVKLIHIDQENNLQHIFKCFYYDHSFDDIPLNTVHECVGILEDVGHASGPDQQVFHLLFLCDEKKNETCSIEWPVGCSELLKYWAISRPQLRTGDGLAIGAIVLNIYNVESDEQFEQVKGLAGKCFDFVRTIKADARALSTVSLVPEYNSESGDLEYAGLQLPYPTCLLIDEREMECGELCTTATKNIKALMNVISNQRVEYIYPFNNIIEIDVDYPCLIVSKEKSLLQATCRLDYNACGELSAVPDNMKQYVQSTRYKTSGIEQQTAELIEVELMSRKGKALDGAKLHSWLTLSRLIAVDLGKASIDMSDWHKATSLSP